jgi:tyrosinase
MPTATANASRRKFIQRSTALLAVAGMPAVARAESGKRIRLEWQQFKLTAQYPSYYAAIRTMRANTNASDPNSWQFWVNVHLNYCPHSVPYFIAWHRGYIYYFEQQLRTVSGDMTLNLPYWDYYTNPNIPSEFTDRATGNPLYQARMNTNVYNALDLAPFNSGLFNFQRGTLNAFEPRLEGKPHNPVHDLIGGVMTTMSSPTDPIFYLHHCNVDRLTHAWALPDGKGIPFSAYPWAASNSSPYWSGNHVYATGLTMPRYLTYDPAYLNYDYANQSVPTVLPMAAIQRRDGFMTVQARVLPQADATVPLEGNFDNAPARNISATRRSLGSATNVVLDEGSVVARVKLGASERGILRDAVTAARTSDVAAMAPATVVIVFDKINITRQGQQGGYFYNVYLNLPVGTVGTQARQPYFLGTLGAVAIAAAVHHGPATLEYPATELLAQMDLSTISDLSVSLVRVSGDNSPKGRVIRLGEVRVEIATDARVDLSSPTLRAPGACDYNSTVGTGICTKGAVSGSGLAL